MNSYDSYCSPRAAVSAKHAEPIDESLNHSHECVRHALAGWTKRGDSNAPCDESGAHKENRGKKQDALATCIAAACK
jgi:hypothetical protein